jgi:hypothetical protein
MVTTAFANYYPIFYQTCLLSIIPFIVHLSFKIYWGFYLGLFLFAKFDFSNPASFKNGLLK